MLANPPHEQFLSLADSSHDNTDAPTLEGLLSNLEACDAYCDAQQCDGEVGGFAPPGHFEDKYRDDYIDYLSADVTPTSEYRTLDDSHLADSEPNAVVPPPDFGDKYRDDYFDYQMANVSPASGNSWRTACELAPWDRIGADGVAFMFGNRYLERAYHILQRALQKDDVCCLFAVDETPETVAVTLCSTWKLTRAQGQARIKCEYRDPNIFRYPRCVDTPTIKMVPVTPQHSLGGTLVAQAVAIYVREYVGSSIEETEALTTAKCYAGYALVEKVLVASTRDRLLKRLGVERSRSLSETTSKIVWKVLIDSDFFSTVAYAHFLSPIFLSDYIQLAEEEKSFLKLAKEDKKMLVLHDIVGHSEFSSSEPFSVRRWTKIGLTKSSFTGRRELLSGPAAVRALKGLHPAMLRQWGLVSRHHGFPVLFEVLAKLVNEPKIPQPVMWRIIKELGSKARGATSKEHFASLAQIVRLYVRQVRSMTDGKNRMSNRAAIALLNFGGVLDWWCAEGHLEIANSQRTWNSVSLRAQEWHVRICDPSAEVLSEAASWCTLVPETRIGEVVAMSLTTNAQLRIEGNEMLHCVGTYGHHCLRGDMQIFALSMTDGQRSTLSIIRSGSSWVVSQNLAQRNSPPAAKLLAAGKKIATLYSKEEKQLALSKK
jgi:hypothetical protein